MKTIRSHVSGNWVAADDGFVPLHDPCSEEQIARVSSRGIDFGATLERVEDGLLRVDVDFRHVRDEHPAHLAPRGTRSDRLHCPELAMP